MASLKRKVRVSWTGREPVEIQMTARDLLNADEYAPAGNMTATGLAQVYAALVRHGHDVPSFMEWLDEVEDFVDVGTVVAGVAGPTPEGPSGGEQLLLRASQDATSEPSLTGTTTDPS